MYIFFIKKNGKFVVKMNKEIINKWSVHKISNRNYIILNILRLNNIV